MTTPSVSESTKFIPTKSFPDKAVKLGHEQTVVTCPFCRKKVFSNAQTDVSLFGIIISVFLLFLVWGKAYPMKTEEDI